MQHTEAHQFLELSSKIPIVDVRSPGEFAAGHIPGAVNVELFTNEERAIIGTLYKQRGRDEAITKGLELVGPKMSRLAQRAKEIAVDGQLLVHCWRGGMRSNSVAWLYEQAGISCTVLTGGYKAYRTQLLNDLGQLKNLLVIDGPTGSGKTELLQELAKLGEQVIDLEGLASHRGSAFGAFGMGTQPTTQQFQNNLHAAVMSFDLNRPIWLEAESLTIGRVYLPQPFWAAMNQSATVQVGMDRHFRAQRLVNDYGKLPPELLKEGIRRISVNFGGNRVKQAIELLEEGRLLEVAEMLLVYYDERYAYGQAKNGRKSSLTLDLHPTDMAMNARKLLAAAQNLNQTQPQ